MARRAHGASRLGHVHGKFDAQPLGLSVDVRVDSHGYGPVGMDVVATEIGLRRPRGRRGVAVACRLERRG